MTTATYTVSFIFSSVASLYGRRIMYITSSKSARIARISRRVTVAFAEKPLQIPQCSQFSETRVPRSTMKRKLSVRVSLPTVISRNNHVYRLRQSRLVLFPALINVTSVLSNSWQLRQIPSASMRLCLM